MYLLSVSLTNFKNHRDRSFAFELGTNAICGTNGAGKTSILEAIAWVLFNYQGSYKKEELIRNGSSSAQARVAFVSSQDSRTYEVERCTSRGYTLYDPQLQERLPYSRIKDEVEPWLREHLGVAPATDLGQLFANTIGVPQGTFTADFLLTTDKRKPIFDRVLKVEEYRQVYQQSNSLRRYAEAQIDSLKTQLQQYDEQLEGWEQRQQRYQQVSQELKANETRYQQLVQEQDHTLKQKAALAGQAQQLQLLQQQLQLLQRQIETKHQIQQSLHQNLMRSQQAADLCQTHQETYQRYLELEKAIEVSSQQQQQQHAIRQQQHHQQQLLVEQQTKLASLEAQLGQRQSMEQQLEQLQAACQRQRELEQQQNSYRTQLQTLEQKQLHYRSQASELSDQEQQIQRLQTAIERLQQLPSQVEQIPQLEQQQQRWQQQLSRLAAARQFQAELQQLADLVDAQQYGVQADAALNSLEQLMQDTPLLTHGLVLDVKTALTAGQRLEQTVYGGLQQILTDLAPQADASQLQQQLTTGQQSLEKAYSDRAELAALPSLLEQQQLLLEQQQMKQQALQALNQELQPIDSIRTALETVQQQLQTLGNPLGKEQLLTEQLQATADLTARHEQQQQHQQQIQTALDTLEQQLAPYQKLEEQRQQQQRQRQMYQEGYLLYRQHEKDAQDLERLSQEVQALAQALTSLAQQETELQQTIEPLVQAFDPEELSQLEQRYQELRSQCDRMAGSLPQQRQLQTELSQQLQQLEKVSQKRSLAQTALKQKERTKRFVNFARRVYKDAGPRITERYVRGISQTADRLFRELLNRPNAALEWTRDYEILVQEGGNTRKFVTLSGGEQMCAALAVRLALLKVLADIDIAFFDEPTTNMDRARRESLAEAIARLKAFKQLFVISHDDTFEKVTEHVVIVERETADLPG